MTMGFYITLESSKPFKNKGEIKVTKKGINIFEYNFWEMDTAQKTVNSGRLWKNMVHLSHVQFIIFFF